MPSSGTLNVNISAIGGSLAAGNYQLIAAGSVPTLPASFNGAISVTGDSLSSTHTYSLGVVGNSLDLTVKLSTLTWTGLPGGGAGGGTGSAGVWDAGTSNNWASPSNAAVTFTTGSAVAFGDTYTVAGGATNGTPTGSVAIQSGGVQPGAVLFVNSAVSYTFSDSDGTNGIGGSAAISVSGGGAVTFTGPNSFSGGTTITVGTLAADAVGALGTGNVVVSGGTLTESVANAMNGATQSLTLSSGTLTLNQPNSYGGGTIVSGGVLSVASIADTGSSNIGDSTGPTNNILTLGGGTLRYTGSGPATTGRNVSLTGASTIVLSGGSGASLTLGGTLSGSGGFTLGAGTSGTLILTGTNSYGTTTISAGTLQIGNGGSSGTLGTGSVSDNASLVFNRSDSTIPFPARSAAAAA